jgi:hypothetical protein
LIKVLLKVSLGITLQSVEIYNSFFAQISTKKDCQVPAPTSQNMIIEYKCGFTGSTIVSLHAPGVHYLISCLIEMNSTIPTSPISPPRKAISEKLGLRVDISIRKDFCWF